MQLYTIGHSTYPVEHLLELLNKYQVNYIIDVRSMPYSRYASQYNSDVLKKTLNDAGIEYYHMKNSFGARQEDPRYYNEEGYLDFEIFRASEVFNKGMKNIEKGLEKYNIALMCTEKNPIDCHRAIMVGRGFELDGIDVKHILHDGELLSQEELNEQLLNRYFPEWGQLSLFDLAEGVSESERKKDYLIKAYRCRNKEIGYRLKTGKEGNEVA